MGSNIGKFAAIDFGIQFLGYIPSAVFQTEKFYDLAGSLTFILLTRLGLQRSLHHRIQANLVTAWAVRLGSFLMYRVLKEGGDRRFDKVIKKPSVLAIYWGLQGVWVLVSLLPTLLNGQNKRSDKLTTQDYIGWGMFVTGFLMEAVADYQKSKFRSNPDNAGKFISHGLWSISRHPNYFGEILLWSGLFVSASSSFQGWQWASGLSPIFIYYLLSRVSGIPILEKTGLKRYGHMPAYQNYLKTVPELVPFIGKP